MVFYPSTNMESPVLLLNLVFLVMLLKTVLLILLCVLRIFLDLCKGKAATLFPKGHRFESLKQPLC